MDSIIRLLFGDKLASDTREVAFRFELPGVNGSFGLLPPSMSLWVQLSLFLMMQSLINIALASFVFRFIVRKRGKATAYLAGYGVALPFVLAMPYYIIQALDVRNMSFMISIASTPTLAVFRCFEAMYGTSPPVVEKDMRTYCMYYSAVIQFHFDSKTKEPTRATAEEIVTKTRRFLTKFLMLGVLYSVLIPSLYMPFPTPISCRSDDHSFWDILHWAHLLNNFILAYLTHLSLDTGTLGVGLGITLLTGKSTMYLNDNPLFASTSVSDFWGRRWNRLVHGVLKRGVFVPVRRRYSKSTATVATFVASGLLHEYIISVVSLKHDNVQGDHREYHPNYGKHLLFFAWNGVVLVLEHILTDKTSCFIWMQKDLPRPVITFLVVMTVLPISHWFTHEYVASGFYTDFSYGFPMIVPIA